MMLTFNALSKVLVWRGAAMREAATDPMNVDSRLLCYLNQCGYKICSSHPHYSVIIIIIIASQKNERMMMKNINIYEK
jgi:hypothetical protein